MATYSELIKELQRESGLGVKEYAEAVNYSTTHLSNILNGQQPGSLKILQACLKHEGIDIQDCLALPKTRERANRLLDNADAILKRHDEYASRLADYIEDIVRRLRSARDAPSQRKGRETDLTAGTGTGSSENKKTKSG